MDVFCLITFFLLGLFFGTFFTCIGKRLPNHENIFLIDNKCNKCFHKLYLTEMVPIFSYIFLRGRCRYCHAKIDNLYTYMELFTGILFAFAYYAFGISFELLIALGIVSMLIIISVSDMSYYIIPDEVLIFFSGYFIIINCLSNGIYSSLFSILSGLFLFVLMYSIMWLGSVIFKKECLGGGDVKMMFVFGLVLHPVLGLISIFIGSLLALPISLLMLWRKNEKMVPFGPFLLISFTFIYFTKIDFNMILDFLRLI